jgi:hypothetical protein
VFITIGTSLVEAKSSYELCMALVHAFLGMFFSVAYRLD